MEALLFYVFACLAVISAIMVITRRNPINSGVWLLGTFVSVAALFVLLNAPFIAMVQITVYAGAILVLMLFVIMLLNLSESGKGLAAVTTSGQRIFALVLVAMLFAEVAYLFVARTGDASTNFGSYGPGKIAALGHTQSLGTELFTAYVWPFEVVSVLLVVAIIGAVILTRRSHAGAYGKDAAADEKEVQG